MGVMPCYRVKCENIMCHTYINEIGYICHECEEEFKQSGLTKESDSEYAIKKSLEDFMSTCKGKYNKSEINLDDFFNQYRS